MFLDDVLEQDTSRRNNVEQLQHESKAFERNDFTTSDENDVQVTTRLDHASYNIG